VYAWIEAQPNAAAIGLGCGFLLRWARLVELQPLSLGTARHHHLRPYTLRHENTWLGWSVWFL